MSQRDAPRDPTRLLTFAAVLFAGLLVLVMTVVPLANNDTWLQMKLGELIVDTGKIPETVLFPFTTVRDNHFNSHEWLASVVFHELDRFLGVANLMWAVGVFALVQFGLCVVLARRRSGSFGIALLLALMAMICAHARFVLRPEIFGLFCLVWLLMLLDRYRVEHRWKPLLWTIPLMLLWVNSHGSFLLAPAVAGLFALGEGVAGAMAAARAPRERLRAGARAGLPYAAVVLTMVAACLVNPAGWRILAFPFQLQQSSMTKLLIAEWLPTFSPTIMQGRPFWIFVGVASIAVALVVRLRRHLGATDAMLFALFLGLALERNRHIVWFGFVALFVCAGLLAHVTVDRRREMRLRAAAAALAVAGMVVCTVYGNANAAHIYFAPSDNLGPGLVKELDDPAITGNVLTSYELGCELIYRDWPRLKPSIDSRVDSYGDDYLVFHTRLLRNEEVLDLFLEGNRVSYMLLLRRDFETGVRKMPSIRANWHIRLTDGSTFLLERNVALPPAAPASSANRQPIPLGPAEGSPA